MNVRDRIAKRIHDLHNPGDWADHDFNGECSCYVDADVVLDELGWAIRKEGLTTTDRCACHLDNPCPDKQ